MRSLSPAVLSFGAIALMFVSGALAAGAPVLAGSAAPFAGVHENLLPTAGSSTTSTNWAGYAVTGSTGSVTMVSAHWVEPAVKCGSKTSYAAFWVGIDGYSSSTVEQTGTIAECLGGSASYAAWWEMYPLNSVQVFGSISAGDHFSASVHARGGGSFRMTITDITTGQTWNKTASQTGTSQTSAEWVAEAPCCSGSSVYPLSNFGHVVFSRSIATVSHVTGGIGSFSSYVSIIMETSSGTVKASPSTLTNGKQFRVTWHHA